MKKLLLIALFILLCLAPVLAEIKCFDCHDEKKESWPKNPHSALAAACEACHGQATKHIESMDKKDIVNPAKLEAGALIKLCGGCHFIDPKAKTRRKEQKIDRTLFGKSIHPRMGFACLDCHDPHKAANPQLLKAGEVKLVCYQCHDDKKKNFETTPHGQHGLQCGDCHDPHGSINDKLFKHTDKGGDICQGCHTDKQPHHFIADRSTLEMKKLRCVNCHQPHSKQQSYLKFKKEELCVHCHKDFY